ncbi:hypothetical protein GCM10009551_040920 [Nocardiopsis tropica]
MLRPQGHQMDAFPGESGFFSQRARVDHGIFRFRPGPRVAVPGVGETADGRLGPRAGAGPGAGRVRAPGLGLAERSGSEASRIRSGPPM